MSIKQDPNKLLELLGHSPDQLSLKDLPYEIRPDGKIILKRYSLN